MLSGTEATGVTVQTLHPKHFDQGQILLQTPQSELIEHGCSNARELSDKLEDPGAEMLLECLTNRLFLYGSVLTVPEEADTVSAGRMGLRSRDAPKITKADRQIDWATWSGKEILTRHRVLGPLWSLVQNDHRIPSENRGMSRMKRIIWSGGFEPVCQPVPAEVALPIGQPVLIKSQALSRCAYVRTCDNSILQIGRMKIEGGEETDPFKAAARARLHNPDIENEDGPLFRTKVLST